MGPLEYINLIRIQNACEKLRKTDNFISDFFDNNTRHFVQLQSLFSAFVVNIIPLR